MLSSLQRLALQSPAVRALSSHAGLMAPLAVFALPRRGFSEGAGSSPGTPSVPGTTTVKKVVKKKVPTATTSSAVKGASAANKEGLDPHGGFERLPPADPADAMTINIIDREGVTHAVKCKVGDNLLFLCRITQDSRPSLYLEGACEASLACSTCHVIFEDEKAFGSLPEAQEKEEDMLDQAACLTSTSRLGCQVFLTKALDNTTVRLPKFSRNFYVDGHVPKPH